MVNKLDLTNKRFGRLLVHEDVGRSNSGMVVWSCTCDCGNVKNVPSSYLVSGNTKSCGCYQLERGTESNITHGHSIKGVKSRKYTIWKKMKDRCKPHGEHSKNYANRGITICEEWMDFANFNKWADTNGYDDQLTLDRIDNDDGYYPDNCRWADRFTQARNTRSNRIITINGESKCIAEWCEVYNIKQSTVGSRLHRGMDEVTAITKPVRERGVID